MDQTPIYDHVRRMVEQHERSPAGRPPSHPDIYEELCRTLGPPSQDRRAPHNGRHST